MSQNEADTDPKSISHLTEIKPELLPGVIKMLEKILPKETDPDQIEIGNLLLNSYREQMQQINLAKERAAIALKNEPPGRDRRWAEA